MRDVSLNRIYRWNERPYWRLFVWDVFVFWLGCVPLRLLREFHLWWKDEGESIFRWGLVTPAEWRRRWMVAFPGFPIPPIGAVRFSRFRVWDV